MFIPAQYDPPNGAYYLQSVGWPTYNLSNTQWNATIQTNNHDPRQAQWDVHNTPEFSHISLHPAPSHMLAVANRIMDHGSRVVIRAKDDTELQRWIIYPGRKVGGRRTYVLGHATDDQLVVTATAAGCVLGPRNGQPDQEWWFNLVRVSKEGRGSLLVGLE